MIPGLVKRIGLGAVAAVAVPALARRLLRNRGLIFMLHRFHNPDLGVPGHDPVGLRRSLGYLRGRGYEIVSLEELFRRLMTDATGPAGAMAFTIDDGYADQAEIGGPVFAEYDCPVTTFVTTGFLDRALWFWWDRITYVFNRTRARRVRIRLGDRPVEYSWDGAGERQLACEGFIALCKTASDEEKERGIRALASEADVPLPGAAPPEYAPMTWDMVRRCEDGGMTFGPHTVNHPILSRTDDPASEREILESWRRVREEARRPVPVFCYPNGQPGDYGPREMHILERLKLLGAVVGSAAYANSAALRKGDLARYQVPRFSWPVGVPELAQYASGLARVKDLVLGRA